MIQILSFSFSEYRVSARKQALRLASTFVRTATRYLASHAKSLSGNCFAFMGKWSCPNGFLFRKPVQDQSVTHCAAAFRKVAISICKALVPLPGRAEISRPDAFQLPKKGHHSRNERSLRRCVPQSQSESTNARDRFLGTLLKRPEADACGKFGRSTVTIAGKDTEFFSGPPLIPVGAKRTYMQVKQSNDQLTRHGFARF